ncbi:MAG: universal stress protein [Pseudomonadota bacterium]
MNRFMNILVVCQEDSQVKFALERARSLATANGAAVTLLDVIDLDQRDVDDVLSGLSDRTPYELKQQIEDYHQARLNHLAADFERDGVCVSTKVVHGVPFVETIRAVLRDGYDIVMKGANVNPATQRSVFLGLDLHLMRKCPCPVMIVNEPLISDRSRVLAAVDPDIDDLNKDCVNRLILDLASSLSTLPGSHLHVAHAWRIEEEHALLTSSLIKASPAEIRRIKQKKRAKRVQELDQLMAETPDTPTSCDVHMMQGYAGDVIPMLAAKFQVDLVVMGTVSRTDIGGLFIGNTAETIISRLECSILAVKPPAFQTPIALEGALSIGAMAHRLDARAAA